jgi:hypothetical protein
MDTITGFFYDIVDWLTDIVRDLPMFLWEHKMWLIALLPVAAVYALYKYLWP